MMVGDELNGLLFAGLCRQSCIDPSHLLWRRAHTAHLVLNLAGSDEGDAILPEVLVDNSRRGRGEGK